MVGPALWPTRRRRLLSCGVSVSHSRCPLLRSDVTHPFTLTVRLPKPARQFLPCLIPIQSSKNTSQLSSLNKGQCLVALDSLSHSLSWACGKVPAARKCVGPWSTFTQNKRSVPEYLSLGKPSRKGRGLGYWLDSCNPTSLSGASEHQLHSGSARGFGQWLAR